MREDWEVKLAPVPSPNLHIPMGQIARAARRARPERGDGRDLPLRRPQPPGRPVLVDAQGFGSVFNLAGGILAWSRDIDPKIPQY